MGTIMDGVIIRKQGTVPREIHNYVLDIVNATIGFSLPSVKPMTPEESKAWHETHAYYDKDGNFHICEDPVEYDGVNKIKPDIKI